MKDILAGELGGAGQLEPEQGTLPYLRHGQAPICGRNLLTLFVCLLVPLQQSLLRAGTRSQMVTHWPPVWYGLRGQKDTNPNR